MTDYFGEPIIDDSPRHAPGFGVYKGTLVDQFIGLFRAPAVAEDYDAKLIDVSKWNGDNRFANCHGAFIRAGYGNGYVDPKLEANRTVAITAGRPFGLYWFNYCGYSVQSHLDGFFNAWKTAPGNLPPVLDFEWTNLSPADTTNWAGQLVAGVKSRFGITPLIYTSPGWWNANILPNNGWDHTYPLWVAHWTTASSPIIPNDWRNKGKTWTFWQWSAEGNGMASYYGSTNGDADMDEDRYHGSLAEFYSYAGVTPPPPPPTQQVVTVKISAPKGVKVEVEVTET